jgi:hypothetical protein
MPLTRAINIGDEARILSKTYDDVDNYRNFYYMPEYDSENETSIPVQFVAPKIHLFEEFRFNLLANSVIKQLEPEMYYRPDYVSYKEYNTINFWALLLFINDIPTIEDFCVENIKIPSKSSVMQLTDVASERKSLEEILPLYDQPLKHTPSLYNKRKSLPVENIKEVPLQTFIPFDVYFVRESFTLTIVDVRNRYIDLRNIPIPESLSIHLQDGVSYLKGRHYELINGRNGNGSRLTWDPRRLNSGIGMMDVMVENTNFEVLYSKKL